MADLIGPGGGCIVGWLLLGFCGYRRRVITLPPRPVLPPSPVQPPIPPEPPPPDALAWLVGSGIGFLVGLAVGYLLHEAFSIDHADSAGIILTWIGALAAGWAAADIVGRFSPRFAA